jgi:two-component system probable response regulator PhcQ
MQDLCDYKKFAVLYVDDEEKSLKMFARAFGETFRILTAANAKDGWQILEAQKNEIALLMTDQRMPGEKGVWLLEKARQLQPRLLRVLVTAYTDMEAAIEAVNSGAIYKYLNKPWDPVQLEHTLKRGLEYFAIQRERDELLKEKMTVLHNMTIADRIVSLGLLAAGLSHHIRNALVSVKTFLDLAPAKMEEEKRAGSSGLRNPDFWKEYHHNVQGQIQKINNLLRELHSVSEQSAAQFADEVGLSEVVATVLGLLQETLQARQIQVVNQISDSLPRLKVDRSKFYRLFELLLKDEIVSLPPNSSVVLSASTLAVAPGARPQIEVQITDNGPGLPKEALRLLFDPFSARSESPAEYGINLMACYFIVHHHGGQIYAQSEAGKGTTFTLRLPINPSEAPSSTSEDSDFLRKVLLNETLWEKLATD